MKLILLRLQVEKYPELFKVGNWKEICLRSRMCSNEREERTNKQQLEAPVMSGEEQCC
jgi:hypothetical protein